MCQIFSSDENYGSLREAGSYGSLLFREPALSALLDTLSLPSGYCLVFSFSLWSQVCRGQVPVASLSDLSRPACYTGSSLHSAPDHYLSVMLQDSSDYSNCLLADPLTWFFCASGYPNWFDSPLLTWTPFGQPTGLTGLSWPSTWITVTCWIPPETPTNLPLYIQVSVK